VAHIHAAIHPGLKNDGVIQVLSVSDFNKKIVAPIAAQLPMM